LKIAIIGGGAAGFFAAITCATYHPDYQVIIFEKTTKLLSKVKVSGGGRCNVTHACFNPFELVKYYPRGEKFLKTAFNQFSPQDMLNWLAKRGVKTKTEADGRIFPISDDSQTIIDCFLSEIQKLNIEIKTQTEITKISPQTNQKIQLEFNQKNTVLFDKVIVTTGGSPKLSGLAWLADLGHTILSPVPSLFTFNMPKNPITALMGVATEANVKVQGTKLNETAPLLITHWGMSGPAILRTSAWGARALADLNYEFVVRINWLPKFAPAEVIAHLNERKINNSRKISNDFPNIPKRLWEFLLEKAKINPDKRWNELAKVEINRLNELLINDTYEVKGKTTFKEEFVTCGGISLANVNPETMQSKIVPNLYFAGEVLDIDGVTGGFNFQAAWTTAYIAGQLKK
jgi:predicted Rossmann fold flavoprotein